MGILDKILLQKNTVFSVSDFALIWGITDQSVIKMCIARLAKNGKIKRLKRGVYTIQGREADIYEIANKLHAPSYVSFETVLAFEGITFQLYDSIFSASTHPRIFVIDGKNFIYKRLNEKIIYSMKEFLRKMDILLHQKKEPY